MSTPDQQRIQASDVAALYLKHADELKRFLIGVLRDGQLAQDVLQTTFAKMVEQGHQTREETRKAWLFRVAYHEALAVRRREAVGDRALRKLGSTGQPDGERDLVLRYEAVEAVQRAMANLPADQQRVVRMRVYEEKTFAVIAEELGIPLGTALGRMRSAVEKLRRALSRHGDER